MNKHLLVRIIAVFAPVPLFLAGCASPTCSAQFRRLPLCSIASDQFTQQDWDYWEKAARQAAGKEWGPNINISNRRSRLDRVWRLLPQPSLPNGLTIVDGIIEDKPESEASRQNLRIIVFSFSESSVFARVEVNAEPRYFDIYDLRDPRGPVVVLSGPNWRAGDTITLLRLNAPFGRLEEIYDIGGEEMASELSYEIICGEKVEFRIYGIRPNKREACEKDMASIKQRLGCDFRLEYTGKPW